MIKLVNIGAMCITDNVNDIIVTHSLSSCVAVTSYCKKKKIGAMIHIALPTHTSNSTKVNECYYADIGLPIFLNKIKNHYNCKNADLELRIYGGADSSNKKDVFNIGNKNLEIVRNILRSQSLSFVEISTGGRVSRTIKLNVATGEVSLFEMPLIL